MNQDDLKSRIEATHKLITEDLPSRQKFESIRTLIKGINPRLDELLETCSKTLTDYEKLQQGKVVDLTLENLPEHTEEDKKRKKALLLFLNSWRDLKTEIERVKLELNFKEKSTSQQLTGVAKLVKFAKGPFGILTIVAVIIIILSSIFLSKSEKPGKPSLIIQSSPNTATVKAIVVNGKTIRLTQVKETTGPECDQAPHYHAKNGTTVTATDGTTVTDPGNCGFGKVSEVEVVDAAL